MNRRQAGKMNLKIKIIKKNKDLSLKALLSGTQTTNNFYFGSRVGNLTAKKN